jgi:starch phosphorylase
MFEDLYKSLLDGTDWHKPDNYYLLKDFADYRDAQEKVDKAYRDRIEWAKKCWYNLSSAGNFSSDRTILEYSKEIWGIKPQKVE